MRPIALCLLLAALAAPAARAQEQEVALVKTVEGAAFAVRPEKREALAVGTPLYVKDTVETLEGSVGFTFKDGTRISMGPNSRLEFKDYAFAPGEERFAFLVRLLRGTMMYVSGVLPKLAPEAVQVETPVATVAVRGTSFLVKIEGE
jgi:hypothetical protein